MRINDKRLFVELSWEDYEQLKAFADSVVIRGVVPFPFPHWAQEWLDRFAPNSGLLGTSTVLPQYILMSTSNFLADRVDGSCGCVFYKP
jgi:hypothetical protein